MEVVSKFHPTLSAKNLTILLQTVSLQPYNQSSKVEKNNAADTAEKAPNPISNVAEDTEPRIPPKTARNESSKVEKNKPTGTEEKASNPLRKYGCTETEISTKSSQNQSSKVDKKTNLLAQTRNLLTRYAKMGTRNLRSQQNHRKTNLAKSRKTNLLAQRRKLPTRSTETEAWKLRSQQNQRKTNLTNLRKKAANTAVKAPKPPLKPKNVAGSIESSYAKLTKLEERKPKTHFKAKNECVIPQKVSTISKKTFFS